MQNLDPDPDPYSFPNSISNSDQDLRLKLRPRLSIRSQTYSVATAESNPKSESQLVFYLDLDSNEMWRQELSVITEFREQFVSDHKFKFDLPAGSLPNVISNSFQYKTAYFKQHNRKIKLESRPSISSQAWLKPKYMHV